MEQIFVFLIRNDVWIYILSLFGLFWYVSQFLRARRVLQQAMFGLERETGTRERNNALVFMMILLVIMGAVFYVNTRIAPTLPASLLLPPTPTPNIFATPLSSPTPLHTAVPPTIPPELAPTVTLVGTLPAGPAATTAPTATPTSPATPTPFVSCRIDLNLSEPSDGSVAAGVISFFGTANTENFGLYRLEANGPQTDGQWSNLLGRSIDKAVTDSFLGNADLSEWASGPYLIRLSAVDADGNDTGACVIQVTLDNRGQ